MRRTTQIRLFQSVAVRKDALDPCFADVTRGEDLESRVVLFEGTRGILVGYCATPV